VLFFFFQAEDGIRDWSVTGVQTCALPILNAASYVAVLVALALMRLPPGERPRTAQALGAGFLSGLRYVWGAPALRNLLLLLGVEIGRASCRERVQVLVDGAAVDTNARGRA